MTDPIVAYSKVMRMQIERLNSIANNAANVNSTGFLQEKTTVSGNQFHQLLQTADPKDGYLINHDLKLGSLKLTNKSTDLGIAADAWFSVQTPNGNAITRNGNFSISSKGELLLDSFPVLGESGPIENINGDFKVLADGSIYVDGKYVDKLALVTLPKNAHLNSLGKGVYVSDVGFSEAAAPKVVQGATISSNADIQSDMTKVVEITRHIEMLQRAMSAYNDVLDTGINKIGK